MVDWKFDESYRLESGKEIVGIDEVGRGAFAGPVVTAAVMLRKRIEGLEDSKKLTRKKRELLSEEIFRKADVAFGISTPTEVDLHNVIGATRLAMERAFESLGKRGFAIVDGLEIGLSFDHASVVKGDGKSPSVAAASIVAKVFRDDIMIRLAKHFPFYGFETNVGYGTKRHITALREHGPTLFHRLTYAPVMENAEKSIVERWISDGKISGERLKPELLQLLSS